MTYATVEVDLSQFDDEDLIEEIETRGIPVDNSGLVNEINQLIDAKVYYPEKFDAMFKEFVIRFNGRSI